MNEKISIVIVDDHPLLLSGLCLLLNGEKDLDVVGQAQSVGEALEIVEMHQPAVVLLDISINETSGLDLLPRIHGIAPRTKVIMLTMHEDHRYLEKALAAGAVGYVLKKGLDVDLLYAIRAVSRGEVYIQPSMVKDFLAGTAESKDNRRETNSNLLLWNTLSSREQQVVIWVAKGFTSREIARNFFLSEKTVSTYRSRAMTKLGFETRAELVEFVRGLDGIQLRES